DLAGGVVAGAGGLVADLGQRRRAEVVRHRATQGEGRAEGVARGQLAGELAAEVLVVLVAHGQVRGQAFADIARHAGVDAGHAAVEVDLVLRREPTAGLRAGRAVGPRTHGMAGRVAGAGLV